MEVNTVIRSPALKRAFHAMSIVNGKAYLHGGVNKYNSADDPFDDIMVFDPATESVEVVSCNGGPKRSHHGSVTLENRWMCVIGGWDGKQRTTDVFILDTQKMEWSLLKPVANSVGPAGLSSHTCTKVGEGEVVITGREGGVHMQRRYGSAYKLMVDIKSMSYCYSELPFHISSRSGHTACLLKKGSVAKSKKYSLVIYGGRDSESVDTFGSWSEACIDVPPSTSMLEARLLSIIPSKTAKTDHDGRRHTGTPLKKPVNLRHHASLAAGTICLVHGGEVFGKARGTVSGDVYVHNASASSWWSIPVIAMQNDHLDALKRMGHSVCIFNDKVYIMAGIGSNGKTVEPSIVSLSIRGYS